MYLWSIANPLRASAKIHCQVTISKHSPTFKMITSLNKDTLETQIVSFCAGHRLYYDYEAMITSKNNLARASF